MVYPMPKLTAENELHFNQVKTTKELGQLLRNYRKSQGISLEKLAALSNVGTRFLSELERGKETAELGKTLYILQRLGIDIFLKPRIHPKYLNKQ